MTRLNTKHDLTGTKEHISWNHVKGRCFNKNNRNYPRYGGKGISMDADMAEDFTVFLAEIGMMPKDGKKYTCGRKNNKLGYIKGNIEWETASQQNRNRGKQSKNTSGVPGVWYEDNNGSPRWVAGWYSLEGKNIRKCFSIGKLGKDTAFEAACACRKQAILELNEKGAGYSDEHL